MDPRVKILIAAPPWYVSPWAACVCQHGACDGPTRIKIIISPNPSDFDGPFELGTCLLSRRVNILIDQIIIDMS